MSEYNKEAYQKSRGIFLDGIERAKRQQSKRMEEIRAQFWCDSVRQMLKEEIQFEWDEIFGNADMMLEEFDKRFKEDVKE